MVVAWVSILVVLLCAGGSAQAQDAHDRTAAAQARFDAAMMLAGQGRYREAEDAFRASLALVPRPNTRFNLAVMLFHQKRLGPSMHLLNEYLAATDPVRDVEQRRQAEELLTRAAQRVATVVIVVSPAGARVTGIDAIGARGVRKAYLAPGPHAVTVSASGYRTQTIRIDAHAGTDERLDITLAREQMSHPAVEARSGFGASRVVPWVLTVGGTVLLAGAAVTGVLALQADHEVTNQCESGGPLCERLELRTAQSQAETLAAVTDVLWITGAVNLAVGIGWLAFTRDGESHAASISIGTPATERNRLPSGVRFAF